MIVYNVLRRWFADKGEAEAYRKSLVLKPGVTLKLVVSDRDDLAALLNALCEPQLAHASTLHEQPLAPVVDRAWVDPNIEVPDFVPLFLISDNDQRKRVQADREARGWTGEE